LTRTMRATRASHHNAKNAARANPELANTCSGSYDFRAHWSLLLSPANRRAPLRRESPLWGNTRRLARRASVLVANLDEFRVCARPLAAGLLGSPRRHPWTLDRECFGLSLDCIEFTALLAFKPALKPRRKTAALSTLGTRQYAHKTCIDVLCYVLTQGRDASHSVLSPAVFTAPSQGREDNGA
jgi:hypothetical protein